MLITYPAYRDIVKKILEASLIVQTQAGISMNRNKNILEVGSILYDKTCKTENIYLVILNIDDNGITCYRQESHSTRPYIFTTSSNLIGWERHKPSRKRKINV